MFISDRTRQGGKSQRHTINNQPKLETVTAFAVMMFLICIENAKSFNVCGKLAKRSKLSPSKPSFRPVFNCGYHKDLIDTGLVVDSSPNYHWQRLSASTSLCMMPGVAPLNSPPLMLDMKTSINAFGGWYNKLDPLARPSTYYEDSDITDYTLASPSDSWPTSLDDDDDDEYIMTSISSLNRSATAFDRIDLSPFRAIRRIGSWVFAIRPMQRIRGII